MKGSVITINHNNVSGLKKTVESVYMLFVNSGDVLAAPNVLAEVASEFVKSFRADSAINNS